MPTGSITTYTAIGPVKRDLEDLIALLDPFDTPLLGTYNGTERTGSALSKGECFEKKVEWQDDTLLAPRSKIRVAHVAADGLIKVTAGDGIKFQINDVLRVGAWWARVTAIATDDLTVVVWDGVDANAAVADPVVGVGVAAPEGDNPEAARSVVRTERHNFTEIFGPYAVEMTETEQAIVHYGTEAGEWEYQTAKKIKEAAVAQEQALVYGTRKEVAGEKRRTMGGLDFFITDVIDAATTSLTETKYLDQLQTLFENGGMPDTTLVGPKQKRVISAFNSADVRYTPDDRARGKLVHYYDSDFGRMYVVLNRWVRTSDLYNFERDQATVKTLRGRGLQFVPLAKTGDRDHGHVVCEKTFEFERAKHAGKFNALS